MIHLFCALKCEAAPLIEHLQLHPHARAKLFRTYVSRDRALSLTITGTGKVASARGVVHAGMLFPGDGSDAWVNIGMAGHGALQTGQPVLADKIVDEASGRNWYPQIVFATGIPSATLITLDKPSSAYRDGALFDMEAAGFYEAATAKATAELCHSLKIISDNHENHYRRVNAGYASELVAANLAAVEEVLNGAFALSAELKALVPDEEAFRALVSRWHFTRTEQIRLKGLLNRWNVLFPDTPASAAMFGDCRQGGDILRNLDARLDRAVFHAGGAEPA